MMISTSPMAPGPTRDSCNVRAAERRSLRSGMRPEAAGQSQHNEDGERERASPTSSRSVPIGRQAWPSRVENVAQPSGRATRNTNAASRPMFTATPATIRGDAAGRLLPVAPQVVVMAVEEVGLGLLLPVERRRRARPARGGRGQELTGAAEVAATGHRGEVVGPAHDGAAVRVAGEGRLVEHLHAAEGERGRADAATGQGDADAARLDGHREPVPAGEGVGRLGLGDHRPGRPAGVAVRCRGRSPTADGTPPSPPDRRPRPTPG